MSKSFTIFSCHNKARKSLNKKESLIYKVDSAHEEPQLLLKANGTSQLKTYSNVSGDDQKATFIQADRPMEV
jgi:hypothetical protein